MTLQLSAPIGADVLRWLRDHSSWLEPGVRLHGGPMAPLCGAPDQRLCGTDALGRPVLAFVTEEFSPSFFDALIGTVARWSRNAAGHASAPPATAEPRAFVLAADPPRGALERCELLARAFSLRVWSLDAGTSAEPQPELCVPAAPGDFAAALRCFPSETAGLGERLLAAARAIRPPLPLRGSPWPGLFIGERKPCAALHAAGARLYFACDGEPGLLELRSEDAVDLAIDCLLRERLAAAA